MRLALRLAAVFLTLLVLGCYGFGVAQAAPPAEAMSALPHMPLALARASVGRVDVADTYNHRVRRIALTPRTVSTSGFSGLTPPQTDVASPVSEPDFAEVIRLQEQSLPASSHTALRIALHAPTGWKVNARAPGMLSMTVPGAGAWRQPTWD